MDFSLSLVSALTVSERECEFRMFGTWLPLIQVLTYPGPEYINKCVLSAEFTKCNISQFTLVVSETFSFEFINTLLMHHFHKNNSCCIPNVKFAERGTSTPAWL